MSSGAIQFGPVKIDVRARQLFRGEREVHLSPKAFDLLSLLIAERPRVIDRRELHARIWPNTHVVDANLNVLIAEIRRALGDRADKPRYIRTVHGVGFSFCGAATSPGDEPGHFTDGLRCWLIASESTFRLQEGENTIGRDPQCDVFLDVPGVSRRHATVRVDSAAKAVVLDDLGSTNGTFLAGAAIVQPTALNDGDDVVVGSVELKVRVRRSDALPETQRIRRR